MPRLVVYHDRPIGSAIAGRRDHLEVIAPNSKSAVLDELSDADMLVVNPSGWDDDFLGLLSAGDWVQATSAGYAAFPVEEFESKGVAFSNAGGNYGPPAGDHVFALLLGLTRRIHDCVRFQQRGEWNRQIDDGLLDLEGRTLTIVGLGSIGEAVARRGQGFDMDVYATKRDPDAYEGTLPPDRVRPPDALSDLLPETDVLALTVPLTPETRHLIDAEAFSTLPDDAILVNVARGPVVDEDALVAALRAGEIAGAGLDVFETEPLPPDSPLWEWDDVIVTPHVGGRSEAFVPRFVDLFLENYDRRRAGDPLTNRIV